MPRRAAGLGEETHPLPHIGSADLPGIEQGRAEQRAAVVAVLLRQPGRGAGVFHVFAGLRVGDERIAGDLAIVVHAKARELRGDVGPVAAPPELEQPVVAQAIFDVGAAPLLGEGIEVGLLRVADAVRQLPVVDPHRQRVLLGRGTRAQCREASAVVLAESVAGVDRAHVEVERVGRARQRRTHQGSRERCRESHAEAAPAASVRLALIY